MERVRHYLSLKTGTVARNTKNGADYVMIVSGGCTIAIQTALIDNDMLKTFTAMKSGAGILFVSAGTDFEALPSRLGNQTLAELEKLRVLDFHEVLFQKWHEYYGKETLTHTSHVLPGKTIQQPCNLRICQILKIHAGKALLYEI